MKFPPYSRDIARVIKHSVDPVRYESFALSIATIEREQVPGAFAEVGVWRGDTSYFIHFQAPQRTLHLFDTFCGFTDSDLEGAKQADAKRFRDTSVATVKSRLGDGENVVFHVGRFPETVTELGNETFSLVVLDLDIYKPTLAALDFFYPRISRGGYCFLHDYNSPESDSAIRRATCAFLKDKPELLVELPDTWGSALFRKI